MSLFSFRSEKTPVPALPPDFISILIRKRSIHPALTAAAGRNATLARQLDVALMQSGFKLSPALLQHLAGNEFTAAINAAQAILAAVKELVGDHVKHNPYFVTFPRNVPDTTEFWVECLFRYYLNDETIYGQHQHSFDEMVQQHTAFRFRPDMRLKIIDLGGLLEVELRELFSSLAGSPVPLNPEDRALLGALFVAGHVMDVAVRIRENKAILNALRLTRDHPIEIDSVVDVLRLVCAFSDGDVTLATNTKFKSMSRRFRRRLVEELDRLIAADARKLEDASNHKERFKRLAEKLHPREYPHCVHAARLFDYTGGKLLVETFNRRAHISLVAGKQTGDFRPAVEVLSGRPGTLLKQVDFILRTGDAASAEEMLRRLNAGIDRISGRNLLNLDQHLANRGAAQAGRIFLNRLGTGHATPVGLPPLPAERVVAIRALLREELLRRIPARDILVVDRLSLDGLAIPLSEKSKSDGFAVLPRGSTFPVAPEAGGSLRFFVYWKQRKYRTDYDLSCACYDAGFNFVSQVSWTNLRSSAESNPVIVHSGDFTDATTGATEFIDIELARLDPRIRYLLPTINYYAGETFGDAEEAFFGFMVRPLRDRGLPFEARTVATKFALKGSGRVCVPMVFVREADDTVEGKWLDVYVEGLAWGNSVENHRFSMIGLVKAMLEKSFTPLAQLVELHQLKTKSVIAAQDSCPEGPVTYIGFRRPEGLHPDSIVITLESFRSLIPA
jgi:hypothetical protein